MCKRSHIWMDRLDCNTLFLLHHCEYILHTRSYYQKVTYRSTCPVWQAAPTLANSFLHVASTRQPTPCWICQKYKKVFIGHIPPCRHCNLQPPGPLFAAFFQSFFINSCTDLQLSRVTGGGSYVCKCIVCHLTVKPVSPHTYPQALDPRWTRCMCSEGCLNRGNGY